MRSDGVMSARSELLDEAWDDDQLDGGLSHLQVVMNPETGKPYQSVDGAVAVVHVPAGEREAWERSWIGKQELLALTPLRECPPREMGQR